jgi:hypothetical protein
MLLYNLHEVRFMGLSPAKGYAMIITQAQSKTCPFAEKGQVCVREEEDVGAGLRPARTVIGW